MERQPPGVTEGQRAQVLDEPIERAGLLEEQQEVGVVARVDAVELGLDLGLQHGQRRAQLVGDVGQEPAAGVLRGVEPAGHVVECPAERADARVDPDGRTVRVVVAAADAARRPPAAR